MKVVDKIRTAMIKTLKVKKVYLVYIDETNQVHRHLVTSITRKIMKFYERAQKIKEFQT